MAKKPLEVEIAWSNLDKLLPEASAALKKIAAEARARLIEAGETGRRSVLRAKVAVPVRKFAQTSTGVTEEAGGEREISVEAFTTIQTEEEKLAAKRAKSREASARSRFKQRMQREKKRIIERYKAYHVRGEEWAALEKVAYAPPVPADMQGIKSIASAKDRFRQLREYTTDIKSATAQNKRRFNSIALFNEAVLDLEEESRKLGRYIAPAATRREVRRQIRDAKRQVSAAKEARTTNERLIDLRTKLLEISADLGVAIPVTPPTTIRQTQTAIRNARRQAKVNDPRNELVRLSDKYGLGIEPAATRRGLTEQIRIAKEQIVEGKEWNAQQKKLIELRKQIYELHKTEGGVKPSKPATVEEAAATLARLKKDIRSGKKQIRAAKLAEQQSKEATKVYVDILRMSRESGVHPIGMGPPSELALEKLTRLKEHRDSLILARRNKQFRDRRRTEMLRRGVMTGVSAGIGLFGSAGMPLLNIGFATLSGGGPGMMISAAATVIGEVARALNALSRSSVQTAESIGFVSSNMKMAKARGEGLSGFLGGSAQVTDLQRQNMTNEFLKKHQTKLSEMSIRWGALKNSFYASFLDLLENKDVSEFRSPLARAEEFAAEANKMKLPELQSQLAHARMLQGGGQFQVESDPYEVWRKAQDSLYDSALQEEQRLLAVKVGELIIAIENETRSRNESTEVEKTKVRGIPTTPFGGMIY
jgi:hypothetical protein